MSAPNSTNFLQLLIKNNLFIESLRIILSRDSRFADLFFWFIHDKPHFEKSFGLLKRDLTKVGNEIFPHDKHFDLIMATFLIDSLINLRVEVSKDIFVIDNQILKMLEIVLKKITTYDVKNVVNYNKHNKNIMGVNNKNLDVMANVP